MYQPVLSDEERRQQERAEMMGEKRLWLGYFSSDPTGFKVVLALKFLFFVGAMAVPLINICIAGEWSIFGYLLSILIVMAGFNVVDTIMFHQLKNAMHWILAQNGGQWRLSDTNTTLIKKVEGIRTQTLVILTSQWSLFAIFVGWGITWLVNHEEYTDIDSKQHTPDKQTDSYNQLRVFSGFIVFGFGYLIVKLSHLMMSISTAEQYKSDSFLAYETGVKAIVDMGPDYPEAKVPEQFTYDPNKGGSRVEQYIADLAYQLNNRMGFIEKPYGDVTPEQQSTYFYEISAYSWILFILSLVGFVHAILFGLLLVGIHTGGGMTLYFSLAIVEGGLFTILVILYSLVARNNSRTYHSEMFSSIMFWGMLLLLQMVIYVYGSSIGIDFDDNIPKFVDSTIPPFPKLSAFFYPFQTLLCFVTAFLTWFASYFAIAFFIHPIDESVSRQAPVYGWWRWYAILVSVTLFIVAALSVGSLNSWVGLNQGYESYEWTFFSVYFVILVIGFVILYLAYKEQSQYSESYYWEGMLLMTRAMVVLVAFYGLGVFLLFGTANEKYHGFGHETFNGDPHYKSVLNPHEEISVGWYNLWFCLLLATVITLFVFLESVMTDTLSVAGKMKSG